MDLPEYRKKVKDLEHYISLSHKVQGLVGDELTPSLTDLTNRLEGSLGVYKAKAAYEEVKIRQNALYEGLCAQCQEEVSRDKKLRIACILGALRSGFYSLVFAPVSREISLSYADCFRKYVSALKIVRKTLKDRNQMSQDYKDYLNGLLLREKHDIQERLERRLESERREARNYIRLVSQGIHKRIAQLVVLEDNSFDCRLVDVLGEYYGIKGE